MGRISTAFRAFFAALGNAESAARIEAALVGKTAALPSEPPPPPKIEKPAAPLVKAGLAAAIGLVVRAALERHSASEPVDVPAARLVSALSEDYQQAA